jgi:hypothetical protein
MLIADWNCENDPFWEKTTISSRQQYMQHVSRCARWIFFRPIGLKSYRYRCRSPFAPESVSDAEGEFTSPEAKAG